MNIIKTFLAVLVAAFLLMPSAQASNSCAQETQESNITNKLPDPLLIRTLEGGPLNSFWDKLRGLGLMGGTLPVDKVYVFNSEHHDNLVYVYFLEGGCIVDVRFTLKTLVMAALE